jgi:hypothetical protein
MAPIIVERTIREGILDNNGKMLNSSVMLKIKVVT